jgi:flagellar M-ring protein FliF
MLATVQEQIASIWKRQSTTQRVVLGALIISALILIPVVFTWANTPSYSVAFSGLDEASAGQIVDKLNEQGILYQLRGSGTILVPSNQVYQVRLRMASDGLPQGGNVGFELFSGSSALGMTEFTQRVNYQRAMEGELERTIGSMAAISAVRVHIVTPEKALLSENQAPTTASITIQEKTGMGLDAAQVRSMTHLVASSVEGLKPENVVVVDVNGNMLASGSSDGDSANTAQTDNHRAAEMAAGNDLQKKVQGLLDSALGPNRSVVQANVTMDWTQRETKQQAYDPVQSPIRSSQTVTEVYTTTGGIIGGIPGASSNLPPVTDDTSTGSQGTNYQRSEHTTNYEITQTETHEVLSPGQIERISLSVLVDGITDTVQLDKLQTVIAAAAGIDEKRGDLLAVQSLAFDRSFYEQQAADLTSSQTNDLYMQIGEVVLAILILGALLWYVQRLLANLRLASSAAWTPVLKPVADMSLPGGPMPMSFPTQDMGFASPILPQPQAQMKSEHPIEMPRINIPVPEVLSEEDEQLQGLIMELAENNPSTVAEIIQMWLNEDEGH